MRRVTINLDDATYDAVQYLARILNKKVEDVVATLIETVTPSFIVLIDKVIDTLNRHGLLNGSPQEVKKKLLASSPTQNSNPVVEFLKSKGGEASIGEVINRFSRSVVEEAVREGLIVIDGVKVRLTRV